MRKQNKILLNHSIKILFVICLVFFYPKSSFPQANPSSYVADKIIIRGDTFAFFKIPEVVIIPEFKFTSKQQKRKYSRLVLNLKKVYPYSKMANKMLAELNQKIDSIDDKKLSKQYIKQVDKELKERYGEELKKLTITQGRLLIKLIDRETGSTSYDLIKELRGSFSAFMWQSLARVFGENLKEEYDPVEEDKMIEHILLLIENNQI